MQPLDPQPALIDRAYERLVEAIADGTLAPGQRSRQEELGRALGMSRQPVSHALQLLKQQAARSHTDRAGAETARRLSQLSQPTGGLRNAAERSAAPAVR